MGRSRDDAGRLLGAALRLLVRDGTGIRNEEGRVATASAGRLRLTMREPNHRAMETADSEFIGGPDGNPKTKTPPGICLDVVDDVRVFSVAWTGPSPITILRFTRGSWEGELMAVAPQPHEL